MRETQPTTKLSSWFKGLQALATARRWPIRYQLLGLALVVAAPLAALVTMNLHANIRQTEELAYLTVRNVAQNLKLTTEHFLGDSQRRLQLLAARPLVRAMDPNRCDPLLREARALLPEYTNVVLRDIAGNLVCGDLSLPGPGSDSAADSEWFREARARADFSVGKPVVGKITGKWISMLTYPVRDDQHEFLGILVLPVDLEFLRHPAEKFVLPPGSTAALIDRDGTYLMHSSDLGRIGRNFRGTPIIDIVLRGDHGPAKAVDADGIERTYFYDQLPGPGWHVYAGIPSDILMAPARANAIKGGIITVAILLVITALGFVIAKHIEAPLREIGAVASAIARGNVDVRAKLDGGREIARVAAQFNAMLDAQQIAQQKLHKREVLLNNTQALAKIGGWEYDVAADCITWTDEVFRIYGISCDYDPGNMQQNVALFFPATEQALLGAAFRRAVEQGEPYDLELQFVAAGGRKLWIRTIAQAERNDGKVVRVFGNVVDITERRRAEETQAHLAAIVEGSNDSIIGRTPDGKITSWNAAAERMLGYTAAEAIGRELVEIRPPELRDVTEERRHRVETDMAALSYETVRVAKDGRRVDVAISLFPIKDHLGRVIRTASILRDITEHKRAERELRHKTELAQLMEQLARAANEAVSPQAAMETCLAHICDHGKWALGHVATYSPGASLRKPDHSQWFCREPARFDAFMRNSERFEFNFAAGRFIGLVLRSRNPVWVPDLPAIFKPGAARVATAIEFGLKSAFAFPVIVDGEVAAFLEFFATDARQPDALLIAGTTGLASQFARMIGRARANEVQARLAAIVENSNEAIIGRAPDGTVTSWNAAAERILGFAASEVIGRDMVEIFPPEVQHEIDSIRSRIRAGQQISGHESVRVTKDGRRIDVALSASPILDSKGQIIGAAATLSDITERKRTERAFRDYAARLQGLSRRLFTIEETERRKINRELHDRIGQNLAALGLNVDIIRSRLSQESLGAVGPLLQKTHALIEECVVHARNVMADLHPPALDDYGLMAALRSYVESVGAHAVVPITLRAKDIEPRLPPAAEMALFRIAQGAIVNAVRHAHAARIQIQLAATAHRVTLTIADDGVGFNPEPFVLEHPSWGLTIMRERAEAVGARLKVDSAPARGTRVHVEIDRPAVSRA